jgi:hypothetical protein
MNLTKRLLILVIITLFVFLFLLGPSSVFASFIDDARKTVVCVVVQDARGREVGWGSGFVLGVDEPVQYVATTWHIVNPAEYDVDRVDVFLWISADDFVPVTVYHSLPDTDMAILRIDPAHLLYGYDPLPLATRDTVSTGDDIYALGYPEGEIADFFTSYYTDVTATKGIISKTTTWRGTGVYQIDAAVNNGNSGGPLINDQGHVIGMNAYRSLDADGINGSIQIDYLIEVLSRRGIPFKPAAGFPPVMEEIPEDPEFVEEPEPIVEIEPEEEEEDEDSMMMFLYIGLGAAALILIILAVVISGRSKKPATAPAAPAGPARAPGPAAPRAIPAQTQAAPPTRAKPKPDAPTAAVTQAKQLSPRGVIKGVSGHFAGQTLEMVNNQLIIGRDPKIAQVVFPQSSEAVSRKHCTIRFDESSKKFTLEDSSSNGTYLSSNQKLESGKIYYLNPGDRFYVAEPSESFEVKID